MHNQTFFRIRNYGTIISSGSTGCYILSYVKFSFHRWSCRLPCISSRHRCCQCLCVSLSVTVRWFFTSSHIKTVVSPQQIAVKEYCCPAHDVFSTCFFVCDHSLLESQLITGTSGDYYTPPPPRKNAWGVIIACYTRKGLEILTIWTSHVYI